MSSKPTETRKRVAGRELDLLVAEKVLTLPVVGTLDHDQKWFGDPANFPHLTETDEGLILWCAPHEDGEYWKPSEDVAAAFDIIEKIGVRFEIWFEVHHWIARVNVMPWYIAAETAPLAICGAALAYIEEIERLRLQKGVWAAERTSQKPISTAGA